MLDPSTGEIVKRDYALSVLTGPKPWSKKPGRWRIENTGSSREKNAPAQE